MVTPTVCFFYASVGRFIIEFLVPVINSCGFEKFYIFPFINICGNAVFP